MRKFVFLASLFLSIAAFGKVSAVDVTLGSTITVTSTVPVAKFEVRVKETIGFGIVPVFDAPTNDPDSDGDVELIPGGPGTSATVPIFLFLTGQPLGEYIIEARTVDANGNGSGWASINRDYVGPPQPVITTASNWNDGVAVFDRRQLVA